MSEILLKRAPSAFIEMYGQLIGNTKNYVCSLIFKILDRSNVSLIGKKERDACFHADFSFRCDGLNLECLKILTYRNNIKIFFISHNIETRKLIRIRRT